MNRTGRLSKRDRIASALADELQLLQEDSENHGVPDPIPRGGKMYNLIVDYKKTWKNPPAEFILHSRRALILSWLQDPEFYNAVLSLKAWLQQQHHHLVDDEEVLEEGPDPVNRLFWYRHESHRITALWWDGIIVDSGRRREGCVVWICRGDTGRHS